MKQVAGEKPQSAGGLAETNTLNAPGEGLESVAARFQLSDSTR